MSRFDWCVHGLHSQCHRAARLPDGRVARCGCECHERDEED